jgi:hypothetical protein
MLPGTKRKEEPMDSGMTKIARLFYFLSTCTILTFLWRFLVPAHEEAESDLMIELEILFEVATVVGLIWLFSHLRPRYDDSSKVTLTLTFWIALVASIGILIMRFSTSDGWYTGHRVYQIG